MTNDYGNCYEMCATAMCNVRFRLPGARPPDIPERAFRDGEVEMVHGIPTLGREPFCRYGHAWLEWNGFAFHPMVDEWVSFIPLDTFYRVGKIDPDENVTYDFYETRMNLLEFEHYGPWHEHPADVSFGSGHDHDHIGGKEGY